MKIKDQIWVYGDGGYFIQATDCQWVHYYENKNWALLQFVSFDGNMLTLTGKKWDYEISADGAIIYERKGNERKYFAETVGGWKSPSQTCSNFHNKDYFETVDGYVYKELPDCQWIILKGNKIWNIGSFVQIREDPIEGHALVLINAKQDYELYEKKVVWNPLHNKFDKHIYPGQWKSSGTEFKTKVNVDPCANAPCLNGGSCTSSVDSVSYFCKCLASFSGTNCQKRKPNKIY